MIKETYFCDRCGEEVDEFFQHDEISVSGRHGETIRIKIHTEAQICVDCFWYILVNQSEDTIAHNPE